MAEILFFTFFIYTISYIVFLQIYWWVIDYQFPFPRKVKMSKFPFGYKEKVITHYRESYQFNALYLLIPIALIQLIGAIMITIKLVMTLQS